MSIDIEPISMTHREIFDRWIEESDYPQKRRARMFAHFEAAANSLLGIALAQLVLFVFGVPLHEAVALNAVMIGVSYARSFVLRVVFARWAR